MIVSNPVGHRTPVGLAGPRVLQCLLEIWWGRDRSLWVWSFSVLGEPGPEQSTKTFVSECLILLQGRGHR